MNLFQFQGQIPASKSMMNRALIIQSYSDVAFQINGNSQCDDVQYLKNALLQLKENQDVFDAGEGGTSFRFLVLRLSRIIGKFEIKATSRLFERPQQELFSILDSFKVQHRTSGNSFFIEGKGWSPISYLEVSADRSSQFLSSVLLNSWDLPFDLRIRKFQNRVSEPYLQMTIKMLKLSGLRIIEDNDFWVVPAGQKVKATQLNCESDLSSGFAIAGLAVLGGQAILENFPIYSQQADAAFIEILKKMGVKCNIFTSREGRYSLSVAKASLRAVQINLLHSPDLFPVLSVLCAFAEGTSQLSGASQLKLKESDRILATAKLLEKLKIQFEILSDGLRIQGNPHLLQRLNEIPPFDFDPDHDHRLAMAAAILKSRGLSVRILTPEVVNKSFPEFWSLSGVQP